MFYSTTDTVNTTVSLENEIFFAIAGGLNIKMIKSQTQTFVISSLSGTMHIPGGGSLYMLIISL